MLYLLPDEDTHIEWQMMVKNWSLAVKSFEKITNQTKFKVVSVGKKMPSNLKGKVLRKKMMETEEFLTLLARAKVLFIPNVHDITPKIMT